MLFESFIALKNKKYCAAQCLPRHKVLDYSPHSLKLHLHYVGENLAIVESYRSYKI